MFFRMSFPTWSKIRTMGTLIVIISLIASLANADMNEDLRTAAASGDLLEVQRLLSNGADVNAKANDGKSALMMPSAYGHLEVVEALLSKGADVNAKTDSGITALMLASGMGHLEVVRELIAKGADVNAKLNNGMTSLIMATNERRLKVVRELITKGADVDAKMADGKTAFSVASEKGYSEVCELLIKPEAKSTFNLSQSDKFYEWNRIENCKSLSQTGGIKIGDKSYPIKLVKLPFFRADLSSSKQIKMLKEWGVPDAEIKEFYTVAEVISVEPSLLRLDAPQGSFITDENGVVHKYRISYEDTKAVLAGFFIFKDYAYWTLSDEKQSVQLSGAVFDTENDTLYCANGARIKSSEWFNLCGIKFKGEVEILDNGIKLLSGEGLEKVSGEPVEESYRISEKNDQDFGKSVKITFIPYDYQSKDDVMVRSISERIAKVLTTRNGIVNFTCLIPQGKDLELIYEKTINKVISGKNQNPFLNTSNQWTGYFVFVKCESSIEVRLYRAGDTTMLLGKRYAGADLKADIERIIDIVSEQIINKVYADTSFADTPTPDMETMWKQAKDVDSLESYEKFLTSFPTSNLALLACESISRRKDNYNIVSPGFSCDWKGDFLIANPDGAVTQTRMEDPELGMEFLVHNVPKSGYQWAQFEGCPTVYFIRTPIYLKFRNIPKSAGEPNSQEGKIIPLLGSHVYIEKNGQAWMVKDSKIFLFHDGVWHTRGNMGGAH